MNEPAMVTITKSEYDKLVKDSEFLSCLEAGGVDIWDWYGEAVVEFDRRMMCA